MPTTVLLGTRNRKKLVELRPLLADLPLELVDVSAFANVPEIVEDGRTFVANAEKKAVGFAQATKQWTVAEDSGLVVPALNGEPGVDSALYAGKHGDDEANNNLLISKIAKLPEEQRGAYYVCVAVLCDLTGKVLAQTEGRCHGRILTERRGTGGFGYDPLFLIPEYHKTFGELSLLVKQALSHRAKAIAALRPALIRALT
jgi:XTP/dITP diphosphohydrolase